MCAYNAPDIRADIQGYGGEMDSVVHWGKPNHSSIIRGNT